ncbi:NUDIX hydrolase [Paenibacillus selenitireducens]|uniref:NUDIX hydrolase n=2 Tax=Paenibacillus selenitireducens TaxID=1324314 RepID=A0A1T2X898_9BACL|nr:NUDIX hydrolase [Paenibacillus selenitireducens]
MEELFDIYDEAMTPLGVAPRSEVHAKGYWHQSFHCWIVCGEGQERMVLFQKRNSLKDTFPGLYDITAAGHLSAGETVNQAARELEEELGLPLPFEALTSLGAIQNENMGEVRGVPFIDREYNHLFGVRCDQPLSSYTLQATEVEGLYQAPLIDMLALFQGTRETLEANGVTLNPIRLEGKSLGSLQPSHVTLRQDDFVPHGDAYYLHVLQALRTL